MKSIPDILKKIKDVPISRWVNTLIIVSTVATFLFTWAESNHSLKISVVLQNGTTMLQDLSTQAIESSVLTHDLIIFQQDCGFFNLPRDIDKCPKSLQKYKDDYSELFARISFASTSIKRYTERVNSLSDEDLFYENLRLFLIGGTLFSSALALVLNQRSS